MMSLVGRRRRREGVRRPADETFWAGRRAAPGKVLQSQLSRLILNQRALLLGSVRQEVLSGISAQPVFARVRSELARLPNEPVLDDDDITAASDHNACRREGIQGASVDFLICACAARLEAPIFTRDHDFETYRDILPITLHEA